GLPKGRVERGEDLLAAANRELMEEIGYGARDVSLLKLMSQSPNYMQHRTQIVLARDLYEHRLEGDEPEPLDVVPVKFSELDELLEREDFSEARSIAALLLVQRMSQHQAQ